MTEGNSGRTTGDEVVSYEVADGVAVITIERPDRRNAMNLAVFDQLGEAARRADADGDAGAVLVRGRGGDFSSGLDTSVLAEGPADLDATFIGRLQDAFNAFEDSETPTLAAIEGCCFGGGIQLAAACHLRAVAPGARLSVMERRWGLVPDLGGTWRLPRLVGPGRATELAVTARRVGTDEALGIGLAEIALDGDDPAGGALAVAAGLAAGPGSVRRVVRLMRENLRRDRAAAQQAEAEAQLECLAGPDFEEAVAAALEGRDPEFVGE